MEKKILEELNKFRLLSNYDNNKTLNENYASIISEDGIAKNVLKAAEELKAAKSAISADKTLLKGVTSTEGKILKSADDILNALKADKIVGKELARVNRTLFNSAESSLKLKNAIAKDLALSDDFAKLYGGLSEKDAIQKLISKKGYTVEQANMITSQYKKNGKSFSTLSKDGSTIDKSIKNKNTVKTGDVNVTVQQSQGGLAVGSKFKIEGKTFIIDEKGVIIDMKTGKPVRKTAIKANGETVILDGSKSAPTVKELEGLETMKASLLEASLKAMTPGFNWKRLVAWAAGLGITGGLLWWYFSTNDDKKVPDDIPTTPPKDGDNGDNGGDGGDFPLEDGAYTTPGDPYQYKVVKCVWYTKSWKNRGKIIKDWISLESNKKATDILDGRHPDARKNCNGNTTPQPVVTTGSTTTQDVVNQQFGVSPQPNAQPEVQTTNDDINNY
jgi:hypothetical protein